MPHLSPRILFAIVAICTIIGIAVGTSQWTVRPEISNPEPQIIAPYGNASDMFAKSLAVNETTILVGAPGVRSGKYDCGAIFVYEGNERASQVPRQLFADDNASDNDFGAAVAVSGANALVGAPNDRGGGESCGAVYAFEDDGASGWQQVAKLQTDPPVPGSRFGSALAIDQNRAVIGAVATSGAGTVYFFERDCDGHWQQTNMMAGRDISDLFGKSVAIVGDLAVVGAQGYNRVASKGGTAYVFQRDPRRGWRQVAQLAPRGRHPVHGRFGSAVAIAEKDIVVCEPGDGVAYLFRETTPGNWTEAAQLVAQTPTRPFMFGFEVAACGRVIAIGSPLENNATGCVYQYRKTAGGEYRQVARLALAKAEPYTCFGWRVAISRDSLLVGTNLRNGTAAPNLGTVYLYSLR